MFFGTTPKIISQYLSDEIKKLAKKRIIIPFAGNFVVEQISQNTGFKGDILSSDVTLYSIAIGYGLARQSKKIELKAETKKEFPIFEKTSSPIEKAAEVIFLTEIAKVIKKKDKIRYYQSLYLDAQKNVETYIKKIKNKLESIEIPNLHFQAIDGSVLVDKAEEGDFVFYDPPVYAEKNDYEKQFEELEMIYDFEKPTYSVMTDELKQKQLREMEERNVIVFYRLNNPLKEPLSGYKRVFHYAYKHHAAYTIYATKNTENFVGTFEPLKEAPGNFKILQQNDVLGKNTKIRIKRIDGNIGNHYRMLWVRKAEMSNAGYCWAAFADDKLFGIFQLMDGVDYGSDLVLINSDPVTPTSRYKKLSKLLLYVICTEEVLKEINEVQYWRHVGFTTKVFTNADSSMKYRGMFKLTKKELCKEGNFKHSLIYQNRDRISKTIKEGFSKWLQKHGDDTWKS